MLPIRSESTRPGDAPSRDERDRGQYMVEFALSFSIFIIFVLIVIDLGLLIYNHNLFYHGVSKGARAASLGADNTDIQNEVSREVLPSYFPTMLLVAEPEPVTVTPDREMHRVDGKQVTVRMDARFGMSMLWFGNVTIGFPIRSSSVIIQNNDQDRDGCKDSLEGSPGGAGGPWCNGIDGPGLPDPTFNATYRRSHLNGILGTSTDADAYLFGGPNLDADSPGANAAPVAQNDTFAEDTVAVGYFAGAGLGLSDSFAIHRPTPPHPSVGTTCSPSGTLVGGALAGTEWESCFGGDYHAPELWSGGIEHPPSLFSKRLPSLHVDQVGGAPSHPGYYTRELHTAYDFDNDGWEDKYDAAPGDPTSH